MMTLRSSSPETDGKRGGIDAFAFFPDGTLLAVGETQFGNNIAIYHVSDASLARTLPGDPAGFDDPEAGRGPNPLPLAYSPDGTAWGYGTGAPAVIAAGAPSCGTTG